MNTVITTKNITKTYGKKEVAVHALRGVDLTIQKGEFTAVVGPSGSGKTTLMNCITGIDSPTSGKVCIHGVDVSAMSSRELSLFRRDNIGFVFQAYNLIPVLTVAENVEYIMLLQGVDKATRQERVARILAEVGLAGYEKRVPAKLSGGQQQRVAIARAMASRPQIIIADEPTANLDSKTGAALLDMMQSLNAEEDMTFLFSTHDPRIMERARRTVVIRDGMIDSDTEEGGSRAVG
ncbi:ABC transporter ATP-binding protein [Chitinivibrio alkaliphilus]|uniref:ABC-type transport system involved in lipoprotein release, ATP-binding protein n=1 Tax=Chitinivibrio alkaliphilus ACht1 TaxID=1313304 RepID=U7D6Y8_9BACT|nr:ABC transporter ATP-binding protein [Chitinivibrio alkaliphilus]ERP38735.1 ABC-type transport system involved in lipoprotein release, ATP-binding protein [Chitinivibrio alkaliphilus ACht1]